MGTFGINVDEAKKKRSSKDLSEWEKSEILAYLEENKDDPTSFDVMMVKYNVSNTTITMLAIESLTFK